MEKEHTNKQLIVSSRYSKHTKAGESEIKKIINENKCDFFMREHGTCEIDGVNKDFAVITFYYDSK